MRDPLTTHKHLVPVLFSQPGKRLSTQIKFTFSPTTIFVRSSLLPGGLNNRVAMLYNSEWKLDLRNKSRKLVYFYYQLWKRTKGSDVGIIHGKLTLISLIISARTILPKEYPCPLFTYRRKKRFKIREYWLNLGCWHRKCQIKTSNPAIWRVSRVFTLQAPMLTHMHARSHFASSRLYVCFRSAIQNAFTVMLNICKCHWTPQVF